MIENLKFVFGKVENAVEKRENAGYQHFLIFPTVFLTLSQTTDFRLFQTERVCRRQFQI